MSLSSPRARPPTSLCLQLESHADLVSAAIHVLPVDQSREGELHPCREKRSRVKYHICTDAVTENISLEGNQPTWPEGLRVSDSDEAGVVNLGL